MTNSDRRYGRRLGRTPARDANGSAHPVDVHVGRMIRVRRIELKLSQTDLGDKLGVAFQQVQKYEKAANCVSVSRLGQIAKALDVPVTYFFEDDDTAHQGLADLTDINRDVVRIATTLAGLPEGVRNAILSLTEGACAHFAAAAEAAQSTQSLAAAGATPSDLDQDPDQPRPANGASASLALASPSAPRRALERGGSVR